MKNRMIKYISVLMLGFFLGGCNLLMDDPEVLIKDRINSFETSLNLGAYSDLQKHFHPEMISYDTYLDTAIFKTGPLSQSNAPFDFGPASVSDISGSDNKTAEGTFGNVYTTGGYYTAEMKQHGDEWKILEIVITFGNDSYTIRKLK